MNADGSDVRRLTRTGALETVPVWSPDGTLIAFTSDRHKKRGKRERHNREFELYVMRADGSAIRRITRNKVADLYPDWQALPSEQLRLEATDDTCADRDSLPDERVDDRRPVVEGLIAAG